MFLGHYGLAFAAKALAPDASLGTTVFAANLADTVWPVLLILGVEHASLDATQPGLLRLGLDDYPWSHSLLTGLAAAMLLMGVLRARKRSWRVAAVCGALVVSHWLLDLPFHRPDLPLWPGGPKVGFTLWASMSITVVAELVVFFGGLALYLRRAQLTRKGHAALAGMAGLLLVVAIGNVAGPAPPSVTAIAWSAVLLWLFVPWAYWVERRAASQPCSP